MLLFQGGYVGFSKASIIIVIIISYNYSNDNNYHNYYRVTIIALIFVVCLFQGGFVGLSKAPPTAVAASTAKGGRVHVHHDSAFSKWAGSRLNNLLSLTTTNERTLVWSSFTCKVKTQ